MDLHARAGRRLVAVCNSTDLSGGGQAPLSAGSDSFGASPAAAFGICVARMRSSRRVSNFTPSSRDLRQITRQRRRAEPFSASNNRKLSGIVSESGMLMRAPMGEMSDKAQSQRLPPSSISHASWRMRWRLAFRLSPRISPHRSHIPSAQPRFHNLLRLTPNPTKATRDANDLPLRIHKTLSDTGNRPLNR